MVYDKSVPGCATAVSFVASFAIDSSFFFDTGAAIMIMSLVLFENEFLHIVSISFTALILNELIMVALEITTW
jgi:hypothetical protein